MHTICPFGPSLPLLPLGPGEPCGPGVPLIPLGPGKPLAPYCKEQNMIYSSFF